MNYYNRDACTWEVPCKIFYKINNLFPLFDEHPTPNTHSSNIQVYIIWATSKVHINPQFRGNSKCCIACMCLFVPSVDLVAAGLTHGELWRLCTSTCIFHVCLARPANGVLESLPPRRTIFACCVYSRSCMHRLSIDAYLVKTETHTNLYRMYHNKHLRQILSLALFGMAHIHTCDTREAYHTYTM